MIENTIYIDNLAFRIVTTAYLDGPEYTAYYGCVRLIKTNSYSAVLNFINDLLTK